MSSPLCILELSRLTRIEKAVKNTTIFVIYKMLVYIQMSQPTTCFGLTIKISPSVSRHILVHRPAIVLPTLAVRYFCSLFKE